MGGGYRVCLKGVRVGVGSGLEFGSSFDLNVNPCVCEFLNTACSRARGMAGLRVRARISGSSYVRVWRT